MSPNHDAALVQTRHPFYGWRLLVACAFILAIAGSRDAGGLPGVVQATVGDLYELLAMEFAYSRSLIANTQAVLAVSTLLFMPFIGRAVDQRGPRRMVLWGLAIIGVGCALFLLLGSWWVTISLALFVWGIGGAVGSELPMLTVVNNWFRRRRATAMAVVMLPSVAAFAFGGVLTVGAGLLTTVVGYRLILLALAAALLVLAWPLSKLVRNRPEDYGQGPDGIAPDHAAPPYPDYTWREALGSRAFWLMTLGDGLINSGYVATSFSLVYWMNEIGIDLFVSSSVYALMSIVQIPFMVAGGILGDRIPIRRVIFAFALLALTGLIVLLFARVLPMIILSVILVGAGMGGMAPLTIALRSVYFGRRNFGVIIGTGISMRDLGRFLAPSLSGIVVTFFGFTGLSLLFIATVGVGALLYGLLPAPRLSPSQRREMEMPEANGLG